MDNRPKYFNTKNILLLLVAAMLAGFLVPEDLVFKFYVPSLVFIGLGLVLDIGTGHFWDKELSENKKDKDNEKKGEDAKLPSLKRALTLLLIALLCFGGCFSFL
ncbi:MAG: hypothetical protein AB7U85_09025 [Alphaproteobacteria bacterium]